MPKTNRKNSKNKSKKKKRSGLYGMVLVFFLVLLFFIGCSFYIKDASALGRNYLSKMEEKNPDELKEALKSRKNEEITELIKEDKINVGALLNNTVFLGDSRGLGFSSYRVISDKQNLSVTSTKIIDSDDQLEKLKSMQPENIVLCYGANDIAHNLDKEMNMSYAEIYEQQVKKIQKVCPNSNIYICSMIGAKSQVAAENPFWSDASRYNKEIEKACKDNGWTYVDCSLLNIQDSDFESDGFHLKYYVYPDWAWLIASYIYDF